MILQYQINIIIRQADCFKNFAFCSSLIGYKAVNRFLTRWSLVSCQTSWIKKAPQIPNSVLRDNQQLKEECMCITYRHHLWCKRVTCMPRNAFNNTAMVLIEQINECLTELLSGNWIFSPISKALRANGVSSFKKICQPRKL